MSTGTLALIIALCGKQHINDGLMRGSLLDRDACEEVAKVCFDYFKDKGEKRTTKCVEEAIEDNACAYATFKGWRKKQTSNYKWAHKLWK